MGDERYGERGSCEPHWSAYSGAQEVAHEHTHSTAIACGDPFRKRVHRSEEVDTFVAGPTLRDYPALGSSLRRTPANHICGSAAGSDFGRPLRVHAGRAMGRSDPPQPDRHARAERRGTKERHRSILLSPPGNPGRAQHVLYERGFYPLVDEKYRSNGDHDLFFHAHGVVLPVVGYIYRIRRQHLYHSA